MKYERLIIYYFTGTGNALTAGRWIIDMAKKSGLKTHIHPIDRNYKPDYSLINDRTLIGFLYPTHGFNAAPAMLEFIVRFSRIKNAGVFLVNTRAGSKLFRWFLPGLSGTAQILPMLILKVKGFKIAGGLPLDMPSNWISLHPGYTQSCIRKMVNRCEKITKGFIIQLIEGRRKFSGMLVSLPVDIAISPISLLYYFIGRFMLAKTFIFSYDCNNCNICVENCPVGAISIKNGKPFWSYKCESCMRCINNCPKNAIQASHLFFAIMILISNIPFSVLIFKYLHLSFNPLIAFIIKSYFCLLLVFFLYSILQRMLTIKFINVIFKYTSLTAYWRHYRAPGIKLKDYKKSE
jgi:ferredoxin/flavodoxin